MSANSLRLSFLGSRKHDFVSSLSRFLFRSVKCVDVVAHGSMSAVVTDRGEVCVRARANAQRLSRLALCAQVFHFGSLRHFALENRANVQVAAVLMFLVAGCAVDFASFVVFCLLSN